MKFKSPEFEKNFRKNLGRLYKKFPYFEKVTSRLNKNGISYGLFAGTHVWLLTSSRETTDLDILVADDDADKIKTLFSLSFSKHKDFGDFIYLTDTDIEFSFNLNAIGDNVVYPFRLTDLAADNREKVNVLNREIFLLNAVDTILLKAILQRGIEQGKHDLEDIASLVDTVEVDKKYLLDRFKECGGNERIKNCLKSFDLI